MTVIAITEVYVRCFCLGLLGFGKQKQKDFAGLRMKLGNTAAGFLSLNVF